MWHEIKCVDTKGKEKLGRHNNNTNGKKKALRLLFIQTFKTITRGTVGTELQRGK